MKHPIGKMRGHVFRSVPGSILLVLLLSGMAPANGPGGGIDNPIHMNYEKDILFLVVFVFISGVVFLWGYCRHKKALCVLAAFLIIIPGLVAAWSIYSKYHYHAVSREIIIFFKKYATAQEDHYVKNNSYALHFDDLDKRMIPNDPAFRITIIEADDRRHEAEITREDFDLILRADSNFNGRWMAKAK
jgi:hypothetical protein